MAQATPRAVIFGLCGEELSKAEREFFAEANPLGFILFARNCREPDQVRDLVRSLKESVGRSDALVLIDQEGGRVRRLRPPHWRACPPAGMFGDLCRAGEPSAVEAAFLNARLLAWELADLGISVNCAPVLDVRQSWGHEIIGDRAFAGHAETVAVLGRATCDGLLAGGVLPVMKHIPGHGRATRDSHEAMPVVDASMDELRRVDFAPFAALADLPLAMTAHVLYSTIDPDAPATTSPLVLGGVVRDMIGFDGLLISDDVCMRALAGTPGERAHAALAAGCDVVLHCNGDLEEMREVARCSPGLTTAARDRVARALARVAPPQPFDWDSDVVRLATLTAGRAFV